MTERLNRLLLTVLTLCAITTTGLIVRRELRPQSGSDRLPSRIRDWRSLTDQGQRIGMREAPVTIVAFSDFECSYCAEFYRQFEAIRQRYTDTVALVYRHFPLTVHQHAFAAAVASECAGVQGRFEQMAQALFENHASLGNKPMLSHARTAGVVDTAAFLACLDSDSIAAVVRRDRDLIAGMGAGGTPVLVFNGAVVRGVPEESETRRMVEGLLREHR